METLAHELGQTFSLRDLRSPPCGGRIMGQLVRRGDGQIEGRRIHPDECAAAAARFETTAERLELVRRAGGGLADASAAPWETPALP